MIKFNLIIDKPFEFDVKKLIKKICDKTNQMLKIKGKHIASFIFVDLETIHKINKDYRNIDRSTDVISFAYVDDCIDRVLPAELGDIFICVEKVFEQANEYDHTPYRECAFLITHGLLHILGYDHMNKEDEEVMFKLQNDILEQLNITR